MCSLSHTAVSFYIIHKQQGYRKELNIQFASGFSLLNLLETDLYLRRTDEELR